MESWPVSRFVLLGTAVALCLTSCRMASMAGNSPAARVFEFTYVAEIPAAPVGANRLRVWIPIPQNDEFQQIDNLHIQSPVPYEYRHEKEYGNRYAYLEINDRDGWEPFEVKLTFMARRREHKVELATVQFSPSSDSWLDQAGTDRFLRPDRLIPTDGVIAALAKQEVESNASPLEKARQVYDYVVRTIAYDKSGTGWGRGDALFICDVKRGNCTDFHSVLIGMLRASGVPARFEMGFPLPSRQDQGQISGYHCWASFYIEKLGWVPVDASEAWKQPDKRDYFFGAHDQHRLLFTLGRDITLDPVQEGEPLNYFIYPYAEADGQRLAVESHFAFRNVEPKAGNDEHGLPRQSQWFRDHDQVSFSTTVGEVGLSR